MAFNARNANFNALKKLNLRQRIEAVNDPNMGQTLISMLTPTQAAELFPKYYLNDRYDIGGFLKAIPSSMTAAKQRAYEQQINNTASGSSAGANFNAGGYRKTWQQEMSREQQRSQISRRGETPPPQLSPEQRDAFNALKSGDIDANDARMKWLKDAPADVLKEVGISTIKDDKGNTKFHYTAPQVSDDQAKASMASHGGSLAHNEGEAYRAAKAEGLSDGAARALVANMRGEALANPGALNKDYNSRHEFVHYARGIVQWDPARSEAIRSEFGKYPNEMTVAEQTKAAIWEMKTKSEYSKAWRTLNDPGASQEQMVDSLVRHYERSAFQDRDVATRINYLSQINTEGAPDPITKNYTPEQIEARKETMMTQIEAQRLGRLASITQPNGPENAAGPVKYNGDMPDVKVDYEKSNSKCGIGVRHIAEQMYGSKYFQGGLGGPASTLSQGNNYLSNSGFFKGGSSATADQLKDQSYLDSLPVGTVISAAGGNERGEGHVQIKIGPNSWASDFPQGNRVLTSRRDGREYHSYTVHQPSEDGMKRLNAMGFKQTMSDSETAHLATSAQSAAASVPQDYDGPKLTPKQVEATQTQPPQPQGDMSSANFQKLTQPAGPVNAAGPDKQTQPEVSKPAAPAAPSPERYNVNTAAFANAIRATDDFKRQAGMFAGMVSDNQIISGFNDDERVKSLGIRLDEKGIMHFAKGQTDETRKMMNDFNAKTFMTKLEDKPSTQVKAMAEGGTVPINTDQISAYPITDMKNDNAVVVNAQQKPLFTMNTDEGISIDPEHKKAMITPDKKQTGVGPMPRHDASSGMMQEFQSTINEIRNDFANIKPSKMQPPDMSQKGPLNADHNWLERLSQEAADPFKSPSVRRVASRAQGMETGDAIGGKHYSRGTNL